MDARPLDVFEDARNQHGLSIADSIHVELATEQVLVDEDGAADAECHGRLDVASKIRRRMDDLHAAPAQYVGGPYQHRISHVRGDRQCGLGIRGRAAG